MTIPRSATNFWKMTKGKVVEGIFAVNKPIGISSAQVIRDLQRHFGPSELFAPWIQMERNARAQESHNQKKRRKEKEVKVKIGHGGTLDPLATGVLITGVGRGTKCLQDFLLCTKEYETVVLFGASTDTYDRFGKVLRKAPTDHITKEMVEKALEQFRGKFDQLPPLYSALKMNGKPLYEYAREGKEIPKEIERRPVEVLNLELVEWMEGGTHSHQAPTDEAGHAEINLVNKLWKQEGVMPANGKRPDGGRKRSPSVAQKIKGEAADQKEGKFSSSNLNAGEESMEDIPVEEDTTLNYNPQASSVLQKAKERRSSRDEGSSKRPATESNEASTVAGTEIETATPIRTEKDSPSDEDLSQQPRKRSISTEEEQLQSFERQKRKMSEDQDELIFDRPLTKSRKYQPESTHDTAMMSGGLSDPPSDSPPRQSPSPSSQTIATSTPKKGPPAVRLRMTVTSGFYVRSLCHDLGNTVGSVALMAELERKRQGDFVVGENTLEYSELKQGESVWGPKVERWLDAWEEKNPVGMRPRGGLARKESRNEGFRDRKSGDGEERRDHKQNFGNDGTFDEEKEKARGFVGRDF